MKTIKTFFVSFVFLCLGLVPISAMGQSLPHTFSANTAAKASEVNANFQYLLERFGTRRTTVNCYSGESITTALQNYNHIVISGICSEILHLEATSLPHRLVILEGSSSSSDGINANGVSPPQTDSSYTSNAVVYAHGSITIKISRLKLTGGTHGVESWLGPAVIIENALIENNTTHGIALWGNSSGWIKNSTIQNNGESAILGWSSHVDIDSNTISGHTNNSSIKITRSGSAWIENNTITNGKYAGISIDRGASADIRSNTIQSAEHGISVLDSSHAILKNNTVNSNSNSGLYVDNNASVILAEGNTFSYNSNYGITLWLGGSLNMWCDAQLTTATTISNNTQGAIKVNNGGTIALCRLTLTSPNEGVFLWQASHAYLNHVTITGSNTYGLRAYGTNVDFDNSTISGSTNAEIRADYSVIYMENTAITGTSGSNEIKLAYGSKLFIGTGTTITGTVYCDGSVDNNSIGNFANLTLTTSGC